MPNDKILITQKEFDEFYAIDNDVETIKEIEKTADKPEDKPEEILSAEEEEFDDKLLEGLPMEDTE